MKRAVIVAALLAPVLGLGSLLHAQVQAPHKGFIYQPASGGFFQILWNEPVNSRGERDEIADSTHFYHTHLCCCSAA
jgi:hypothetical protein